MQAITLASNSLKFFKYFTRKVKILVRNWPIGICLQCVRTLLWFVPTMSTLVWIDQNKKGYGLTKTSLMVHVVCLHFPNLQTFLGPRNNKQHWFGVLLCPTVPQLTDVRMVCYALVCLPVDAKPQKFAVEHPLASWLLNPFFLSFKYTRIDS